MPTKVTWMLAVSPICILLNLLPMVETLCSSDAECTLTHQTCAIRTSGNICECAKGYYFIQGRCKTSVGELCSSSASIDAALGSCGISTITLLPLVFGSMEDKCTTYLKIKPCVVSEIQKRLATCSVAEIADGVGKYANTAIQAYNVPPIDFSVLDSCQAAKIKVVFKLVNSYWFLTLADTGSPPYWLIIDKYDKLINQMLKHTFNASFVDSAITYLRQGEGSTVLADVTLQLTQAPVGDIRLNIIETIGSNTNYSQWFSVESATASTAVSCTLDDLEYQADLVYQDGERFRSSDSCSRCLCNNGQVTCTSMTCTSVWIKETCISHSMCMTENAECYYVCVCKVGYKYNDETAKCDMSATTTTTTTEPSTHSTTTTATTPTTETSTVRTTTHLSTKPTTETTTVRTTTHLPSTKPATETTTVRTTTRLPSTKPATETTTVRTTTHLPSTKPATETTTVRTTTHLPSTKPTTETSTDRPTTRLPSLHEPCTYDCRQTGATCTDGKCGCGDGYFEARSVCRRSAGEACSSPASIDNALVNCDITVERLMPLVTGTQAEQCKSYLKMKVCVVSAVQKLLVTCSVPEITDAVHKAAKRELAKYLLSPDAVDFSVLENCKAAKRKVVLQLIGLDWYDALTDTGSPQYWAIMDRFQNKVRLLLMDTFPGSFVDSTITRLSRGSVLAEISLQLTEEPSGDVAATITQAIVSDVDYSTTLSLESVSAVTAMACIFDGLTYTDGEIFRSNDTCNRCVCNNGNVTCTKMNCSSVWINEPCSSDTICGTQHAQCTSGVCRCQDVFQFNETTAMCAQKITAIGDEKKMGQDVSIIVIICAAAAVAVAIVIAGICVYLGARSRRRNMAAQSRWESNRGFTEISLHKESSAM